MAGGAVEGHRPPGARRGVELGQRSGASEPELHSHLIWLDALRSLGAVDEALVQAERNLATAEKRGNVRAALNVLNVLGGLATDQGRYDVARTRYRRSLELARASGNRVAEAAALASLGDVSRCLGHYDDAIEMGETAARVYREVGFTRFAGLIQMNIATAWRLKGDATRALEHASIALAMVRDTKNADQQAAGALVAGEVHFALQRLDEAGAFYDTAVALYRQVGRDAMALESQAGAARVAWASGDRAAARACIADVVAHLDAGGQFEGTEDPLAIQLTCYRILDDTDPARARRRLRGARGGAPAPAPRHPGGSRGVAGR